MTAQTRIETIAACVLAQISDSFQKFGDELSFNCPINGTAYDIQKDDKPGTYYIAIEGKADFDDDAINEIGSIDLAKAQVARLVAENIIAVEARLETARSAGFLPA